MAPPLLHATSSAAGALAGLLDDAVQLIALLAAVATAAWFHWSPPSLVKVWLGMAIGLPSCLALAFRRRVLPLLRLFAAGFVFATSVFSAVRQVETAYGAGMWRA